MLLFDIDSATGVDIDSATGAVTAVDVTTIGQGDKNQAIPSKLVVIFLQ